MFLTFSAKSEARVAEAMLVKKRVSNYTNWKSTKLKYVSSYPN